MTASRISSTRPPSLSAFLTLLKKPSTFPCSASGSSSRRTSPSFLTAPVRQTRLETLEGAGLLFQFLPPFSLIGITPRNRFAERFSERFDPGCQRFYRLLVCFRTLGHSKRCGWCMWDMGHTSQFSRIKQRPPATDLSGGNTSAESLTPRRSTLAGADAMDFQFDLLPSPAAPAPVPPDFCLLPLSGCLSFFFSLENESRMSSMSMLGQGRWRCNSE